MSTHQAPVALTPPIPGHWTPEQALAVFECLEALRDQLWGLYGPQIQQAWRDQLVVEAATTSLTPDDPF